MTAYWPPAAPVADLGDIPDLTAGFRPFRPVEPAPLRDPALNGRPGPEAEKECGCGVLKGEDCDCADFAAQLDAAPVIWFGQQRRAA